MGDRDNLPELPNGWIWVAWKEIGFSQNGRSFPSKEYQNSGIKLLRPGNLHESGKVVWTEANTRHMPERWAIDFSTYIVGSNELVMNLTAQSLRDEFLGRVCITGASERCLLNQRIARLTPIEVPPKYLLWMFKSPVFRRFVDSLNTGSLIQHMFTSQLEEFYLPLPPLAEQHRIVAKIEELFSELDAGVELLKKLKAKLKRYRQAVLKAAVEGKLTKEWREAHQGELEPASVLLERILKERREKWEAEQLAQMKAKGKTPKDDSWKLKYKEPVAPDTSDLPELPEGWVCASLEQLSWDSGYGTSEKCNYEFLGSPVLRIPNIVDGRIDLSDLKYAAIAIQHDKAAPLAYGDLLVIRTNGSKDLIGRAALVNQTYDKPYFFASYLIRFRIINVDCLPNWLIRIWHNSRIRTWIERVAATSAGQHNVSMSVLNRLPLEIPPLAEQHYIIEEIERCFSVADEVEKVVDKNLKRAERLRQSILKKAFEGKLVPQDLTDEPADKLLERIKAEKAKREAEAKAKKKQKQPGKSQQLELF